MHDPDRLPICLSLFAWTQSWGDSLHGSHGHCRGPQTHRRPPAEGHVPQGTHQAASDLAQEPDFCSPCAANPTFSPHRAPSNCTSLLIVFYLENSGKIVLKVERVVAGQTWQPHIEYQLTIGRFCSGRCGPLLYAEGFDAAGGGCPDPQD